MNITKLTPVVEQLQAKLNVLATKTPPQAQAAASAKFTAASELEQEIIVKLLATVSEFKKWTDKAAKYNSDASLQSLPLEYYQICAQQQQLNYEQLVQTGIPALLALGIVNKDGKLL